MKRLSRKLSEVEIVMTTQEGKANQMRKERDAERAENEQLKKEIIKLNNQLLKERMMISASIKRNITEQQDETVTDGKQESGDMDFALSHTRRGSLPVTSVWKQNGRRGSQDHPKDLRKLLDRRSNDLLQQRQQYRIFENRFQKQADRCDKLDRDLERLSQLLVKLLGLHGRHHGCSVFQHNNIVMLGRKIKLHCTNLLLFSITLVLVLLFVFLALEG